ncbi:MAG: hypothetical protein IJ385_01715 [Ruminiclostridium sp.]|nr:hypothetical protein [Ruminiclostridium sp.]
MNVICKRCLLSEINGDDVKKTIDELIMTMPEDKKADDTLYRQRLDICKSCDELINGMCGKCGCYVELRALQKVRRCPHELKKW